ncbi:hypothetical protein [Leucobacter manosquensis]|uniref:Uncharacterized protein n=1 Tax=Leucobacter manosquensis TaxID=2810611 RepID=A0ABS5M3T6_9MICO|nr:hypothetical protein [Leucobacter manosquensis]MBS3181336.1 hypothetical protein [Leucobacter manosquensis]
MHRHGLRLAQIGRRPVVGSVVGAPSSAPWSAADAGGTPGMPMHDDSGTHRPDVR